MEKIEFSEFKRLCFCNSDKLMNKVFVVDGTPHEWVGIGIVECQLSKDPKKNIEVVDDGA